MKEDQPMVIKLSFWSWVLNIQYSYEREVGAGRQAGYTLGTLKTLRLVQGSLCKVFFRITVAVVFLSSLHALRTRTVSVFSALLTRSSNPPVRVLTGLWYPWLVILLKWTLWMCMRQRGRGREGKEGSCQGWDKAAMVILVSSLSDT